MAKIAKRVAAGREGLDRNKAYPLSDAVKLLKERATAKFDETYIRESIINPNAKIVRGYPAVMPTYRGQLSEEQILDLIAYIKSLTPEKSQ